MSNPMGAILEQDLAEEVAQIQDFAEQVVRAVDENITMVIPMGVYARHLSVLYLVIECLKEQCFQEGLRTGDYRTWNRIDKWLDDRNI